MNRRDFLTVVSAVAGTAQIEAGARGGKAASTSWPWEEADISRLRRALESGELSPAALVRAYLRRIQRIDRAGPRLNSVIEVNPDTLPVARSRKASDTRGPLQDIPILLKDNIDTHDRMMTTAGSRALLGSRAPRDAFLVERLREAGAIILGKTNLSEWANFRSSRSTSGWSGRGGLTRNPYVLDRNTSGSSSGSAAAVAANLCAAAIGTETDGSIISPSTYCGIVGLKPTVGLVSRSGIIPISSTQDTAGPMTRTVRDAAIVLGCLTGVDPRDPATEASQGHAHTDYTPFLERSGLKGARIGVARQFFHPRNERVTPLLEAALEKMKAAGADLIDPVEIPSYGKFGDAEFQIMLYEFKDGLNKYLASLGPEAPIRTLAELIAFNEEHAETELRYFGQETLLSAEKKGDLTEDEYLKAREKCRRLARDEGIDAVMAAHRLDALVAPSGGPAHRTDLVYGDRGTGGSSSYAAVAGYPSITVPAGFLGELPFGISFFGRAWSEPILLRIAYGFEQSTRVRRPPKYLTSVDDDE